MDNPDSVFLELAAAYREAGRLEDRLASLECLDRIRRTYFHDPDYYWERARTLLACSQPMNARHALEKVIELRPDDAQARVLIGRILLKDLLHHYDLRQTEEIIAVLEDALALQPDHRDGLFLLSLALHLAGRLPESDPLPLAQRARRCLERILETNPEDHDARLLLAVELLDLGETDQADLTFQDALERMPEDLRAIFESLPLTAGDSDRRFYAELSPEKRPYFPAVYWRQQDPTPLTPANENLLEYWKRLVLSEFFFGNAEKGVRGWETDPGRIFIRYGPPEQNVFSPGAIEELPSEVESNPVVGRRGRKKGVLDFEPPSWNWSYRFPGLSFDLKFEDPSLQGTFLLSDLSTKKLIELRRGVPAVFHETYPGQIRELRFATAGIAGAEGKTQESVYLGVAPWRDKRKGDWWEKTYLELVLRDSQYEKVAVRKRRVDAGNLYHPVPGADLLVFADSYDLPPGKYSVEAFLEDRDSEMKGGSTIPLHVRDYGVPGLQISDLELALTVPEGMQGPRISKLGRSYVPNPMGLVGDDRNLDVLFEIYNLTADERGAARYLARYTVLPKEYARSVEDLVRRGRISAADSVRFGGEGASLGGTTLGASNWSDVLFPEDVARLGPLGKVVKGAVVDLKKLDTGEYALLVTVTDRISNASASAMAPFRIVTDPELRQLLRAME